MPSGTGILAFEMCKERLGVLRVDKLYNSGVQRLSLLLLLLSH